MIDTARAGPVTMVKYGRPVVVVLAVEEYERLKAVESGASPLPKQARIAKAPRNEAGR